MSLEGLTALLLTYRYWIIFPAAIIEGPIVAMVCGVLIRTGMLELVPVFIALYLGDLVGDIGWYWVGRRYGHGFIRRFGKYISITEEHVAAVEKIFHRYHARILLFSKVTMGLGFPGATLFTAGLVRIPFWTYLALNAIGQVVWTAFLLAVGYFLGDVYVQVNGVLEKVAALSFIAIIFMLLWGLSKYVRSALTKQL